MCLSVIKQGKWSIYLRHLHCLLHRTHLISSLHAFPDGAAGRRKLGIKTNTISSSRPQLNHPPTQRVMISVKVSIIIVRSHDHNFRHSHYDVREVNVPRGCDYSSSVAVRGMQA